MPSPALRQRGRRTPRTCNVKLRVLALLSLIVVSSCDQSLRNEVREYRGDGKAYFLTRPILGMPGVRVEFPEIDLSLDHDIDYRLDGIPATRVEGNPYVVGLLVPSSPPEDILRDITWSVEVSSGAGTLLKRPPQSLDKATATSTGGGPPTYYFMDGVFMVAANQRDGVRCRIRTRCTTPTPMPLKARLVLSYGGYE